MKMLAFYQPIPSILKEAKAQWTTFLSGFQKVFFWLDKSIKLRPILYKATNRQVKASFRPFFSVTLEKGIQHSQFLGDKDKLPLWIAFFWADYLFCVDSCWLNIFFFGFIFLCLYCFQGSILL